MAMQTGVGLSKILILAGAGYTGTILLKNGKLADLLGELQSLVRGLEKSGEQSDDSDALMAQVRRLSAEIRNLSSARQITVLNGNSGGNLASYLIPVASLGALGYGYMWWKGMSFADLFWVTKSNMAKAVKNLTDHLDSVSESLSAAKKHLTQRIQNLDDKMEVQKEISKSIKEDVEDACMNISNVQYDLDALQRVISGLDGKVDSLEYKQDVANVGIWYLCNMAGYQNGKMAEVLQQLKFHSKSPNLLTNSGTPTKSLKDIADILSGREKDSGRDIIVRRSCSARC
ncbi:hypothetical protein PTKIN_Ptkin17bG0165200 [Pterospermum kingtungense]